MGKGKEFIQKTVKQKLQGIMKQYIVQTAKQKKADYIGSIDQGANNISFPDGSSYSLLKGGATISGVNPAVIMNSETAMAIDNTTFTYGDDGVSTGLVLAYNKSFPGTGTQFVVMDIKAQHEGSPVLFYVDLSPIDFPNSSGRNLTDANYSNYNPTLSGHFASVGVSSGDYVPTILSGDYLLLSSFDNTNANLAFVKCTFFASGASGSFIDTIRFDSLILRNFRLVRSEEGNAVVGTEEIRSEEHVITNNSFFTNFLPQCLPTQPPPSSGNPLFDGIGYNLIGYEEGTRIPAFGFLKLNFFKEASSFVLDIATACTVALEGSVCDYGRALDETPATHLTLQPDNRCFIPAGCNDTCIGSWYTQTFASVGGGCTQSDGSRGAAVVFNYVITDCTWSGVGCAFCNPYVCCPESSSSTECNSGSDYYKAVSLSFTPQSVAFGLMSFSNLGFPDVAAFDPDNIMTDPPLDLLWVLGLAEFPSARGGGTGNTFNHALWSGAGLKQGVLTGYNGLAENFVFYTTANGYINIMPTDISLDGNVAFTIYNGSLYYAPGFTQSSFDPEGYDNVGLKVVNKSTGSFVLCVYSFFPPPPHNVKIIPAKISAGGGNELVLKPEIKGRIDLAWEIQDWIIK